MNMKITKEILATMDYVNDASCRTRPSSPLGSYDNPSKDYRGDKEYLTLDYSDMEYQEVYIRDEEFICFNNNSNNKKVKILSKTI